MLTQDGTLTVQSGQFGVSYHSMHGAWTETQHVFIQNGLAYLENSKDSINILEMGFGTGMNALATLEYARDNSLNIHYTTIEKFPLESSIIDDLMDQWVNLKLPEYSDIFRQIHALEFNTQDCITTNFSFEKYCQDILVFNSVPRYDLIYFDAFGPETQPELWTADLMASVYDWLLPDGVLVTYCAQGQFKRNLRQVGFTVEALPGPPGKREMTRAIKLRYDQ